MKLAVERKARLMGRGRPFRGLALALFALFGGVATAAQAMLLTLDLRWNASNASELLAYNLQPGSIIQVIGYKDGEGEAWSDSPVKQFEQYGTTSTQSGAAPYASTDTSHAPDTSAVYLADSTQEGHEILYTGAVGNLGSWYGLYTQITVDNYLYDRVYIRVFGAKEFKQGEVIASYWGVSPVHTNAPSYSTDTLSVIDFKAEQANYFEVIPEPATVGLLGLGGIALAAWRRRRCVRGSVREEE